MRASLLISTAVAAIAVSASGLGQAQTRDVTHAPAFGTRAAGQKLPFTDEQRIIMHRYVIPRLQYGVTTGSTSGDAVAAGDRIPDSGLLHPLPAAVDREAPRLRPYRYVRTGTHAYAVNPRDRWVIEEID